jgi:hypothetical protein
VYIGRSLYISEAVHGLAGSFVALHSDLFNARQLRFICSPFAFVLDRLVANTTTPLVNKALGIVDQRQALTSVMYSIFHGSPCSGHQNPHASTVKSQRMAKQLNAGIASYRCGRNKRCSCHEHYQRPSDLQSTWTPRLRGGKRVTFAIHRSRPRRRRHGPWGPWAPRQMGLPRCRR